MLGKKMSNLWHTFLIGRISLQMIAMVPYFRRNVAHGIVELWMFASECESLRLARPIWRKALRGRAGPAVRM
jgi:hypothetical protein